jgi:apolipoprotein N-acyltransferase
LVTRSYDILLAGTSGLLLAFSFPTFGHPALAWIALAPLLVALQHGTLRRAFVLGATAGGLYFAGTLYWLTRVMVVYGGLSQWVGVAINVALIAFLALFPAAFAVIVRRLVAATGPRALLVAPFVWAATELGRTYLFGGFPWVLLGYSQAKVLPVIQLASLVGVYGVGGLVAGVSAAAAYAVSVAYDSGGRAEALHYDRDSGGRAKALHYKIYGKAYAPLAIVLAAVLVVAAWGGRRVSRAEWTTAGDPVRVGLIQGNVDQGEKWNEARAASIFTSYLVMSREAIREGAQVVIWPESSTPFFFEEDRLGADRVRRLAEESKVTLLLGSDQMEHSTPPKYFNSAFLVRSDGTTAGVYRKMHLVPFGEYVPRLFFFANRLVEAISDFSPGESTTLLPIGGHLASTAICYEIVYPDLVRQFVRQGSELLTTITNDAWFGRTSAPYQHFEQASVRAVEEGRYLVRAANTGISGIVDPYGRVVAESRIYEPAVIVGEARFLRGSTLYARTGDLFAYLSTLLTAVLLLQSLPWRLSTT